MNLESPRHKVYFGIWNRWKKKVQFIWASMKKNIQFIWTSMEKKCPMYMDFDGRKMSNLYGLRLYVTLPLFYGLGFKCISRVKLLQSL